MAKDIPISFFTSKTRFPKFSIDCEVKQCGIVSCFCQKDSRFLQIDAKNVMALISIKWQGRMYMKERRVDPLGGSREFQFLLGEERSIFSPEFTVDSMRGIRWISGLKSWQ
ncbi:hypothetical protein NPIL_316001 [Nephila pilipes]|uniref:Uncharacterized protein n=1 Tax=Nephila pilipes TaxID=299642 RepID=A0A8X6THX6_NEPPI|nr:hypothetical protein NPIL_316001 [Nephila pilipes]